MVKKMNENKAKEYYQWQNEDFSKEEFVKEIRKIMQELYPIKNALGKIERLYFPQSFDGEESENYHYDSFESAKDKLADCYRILWDLLI